MERSLRVVVVHDAAALGGRADAHDVFNEVAAVEAVLAARGHAVSVLGATLDLAALERALERMRPDIVFNLVDSLEGRGRHIHLVPGLLERLGIAFTGCGAATQLLSSNKIVAKQCLAAAGIAVPETRATAASLPDRGSPTMEAPNALAPDSELWIVKSCWEHASIGLDDASVAPADAVAALIERRRAELGGEWLAERYVAGRELNVGLLESADAVQALPVAEIAFIDYPRGKPQILGYAAKWEPGSVEYRQSRRTFEVDAGLAERLLRIARACWQTLGAAGYVRVDFRVDAAGQPWVLEVNANPCLSPDAGFAAMLEQAGIAYDSAVERLVAAGLRRAGRAAASSNDV